MNPRGPQENPWLAISASDYEEHMSSFSVQQLPYLSRVFREVLSEVRPTSIAVLGCATGNGFEHIPRDTRRVLGIDINAEYLGVLRGRFASALPGMQLMCTDITTCDLDSASLELVHVALVLEYVDSARVLDRLGGWLCAGGTLSVVLQIPSETRSPISDTEYLSLRALESIMRPIAPWQLEELAARAGFVKRRARVDTLVTGRQFYVGLFA